LLRDSIDEIVMLFTRFVFLYAVVKEQLRSYSALEALSLPGTDP